MSQVFNKMKIEVKREIVDIITAKQNDTNSRYLDVYLYDDGTPLDLTGQEVRIYMKKPDGKEIFNDGEITEPKNGRCQFLLSTEALKTYGVLEAEISIWENNTEIVTTQTFHIFVTESLRTSGSVESSNEYGALVVLFQNLYQALDLMTEMGQNFGQAGEVATGIPVSTFWQMLEELYTMNKNALTNSSVSEVLNRLGVNTDNNNTTIFGLLKNSGYGLEVLKNKILENRDYYISYGTNTTFFTSGKITGSEEVYTGNFTAQEDGDYRIDFSMTIKNNNNTNIFGSLRAKLSYVGQIINDNIFYSADNYDTTIPSGGSSTFSATAHCYMQKAIPIRFLLETTYGNTTVTLNSLTVKGNKVQNKM